MFHTAHVVAVRLWVGIPMVAEMSATSSTGFITPAQVGEITFRSSRSSGLMVLARILVATCA